VQSSKKSMLIAAGKRPELKVKDNQFQVASGNGGTPSSMLCLQNASAIDVTTPRQIRCLNGIAEGGDFTSRVGKEVVIRSVQMYGTLIPIQYDRADSPDGWAESPEATSRILLVWDLQPNSNVTLGSVYKAVTGPPEITSNNLFEVNNEERFIVLWQHTYKLGLKTNAVTTESVTQGYSCKLIKMYKKLNLKTTFVSAGDGFADISTGCLWLITVGTGADGHQFVGNARIRFYDP